MIEKGAGIACRLYGYEGELVVALYKTCYGTVVKGMYNPTEKVGFMGFYSGGQTGFGAYTYQIKTMEELKEEGYELVDIVELG